MENNTNALPAGTRLTAHSVIYELTEVLGQGGFGITYKAELLIEGALGLTRTGVFFAIKEFFLSDINVRHGQTVGCTESQKFGANLKKFERESRLLSQLSHAGICHVQDAFPANGTAYYVMDFYPGGSLSDIIRRSPGGAIPQRDALEYFRQIGSALSYLHGRGMAHLDLKPQNIMLAADGRPVLIDFGISKQFDDDGQFRSSDTMGGCTPGYAPLEQANYAKGDGDPHMMDIYALGATLYKMLTGQTPPKASEVLNNGLPLGPLRDRGVSQNVIDVIDKTMQPVKRDRYQSVAEMLAALGLGEERTEIADDAKEATVVAVQADTSDMSDESDLSDQSDQSEQSGNSGKRSFLIIAACVAAAIVLCIFMLPDNTPKAEPAPEAVVAEMPDSTAIIAQQAEAERIARERDSLARVKEEDEKRREELNKTYGHTTPAVAELCAVRDGRAYYFTRSEWNAVPSDMKPKYAKKGVYVSGGQGAKPFLIEIRQYDRMTWHEAVRRFGSRLPSKAQADAIVAHSAAISAALRAYGKDPFWFYWTGTSYSDGDAYEWAAGETSGSTSRSLKSDLRKVRLTAPIP